MTMVSMWSFCLDLKNQDDMIRQLSQAIKKFAKRQMTWFKRNPDIVWLDMAADPFAQACDVIDSFLKKDVTT